MKVAGGSPDSGLEATVLKRSIGASSRCGWAV